MIWLYMQKTLARFNVKMPSCRYWIRVMNITRPIIFTMEIPIPEKTVSILRRGPERHFRWTTHGDVKLHFQCLVVGCIVNIWYNTRHILKLKWFSSCLEVVFAQSIEARLYAENEDVVGAALTGAAPNTSGWCMSLLPTKLRLIIEVWR